MRTQLYRAALVATWILASTWPVWGERAESLAEAARASATTDSGDQRVAELP